MIPFRYIVLSAIILLAVIRFIVFPHWDKQMKELFAQQEAHARFECGSGVITTDGNCHPLRSLPHR